MRTENAESVFKNRIINRKKEGMCFENPESQYSELAVLAIRWKHWVEVA